MSTSDKTEKTPEKKEKEKEQRIGDLRINLRKEPIGTRTLPIGEVLAYDEVNPRQKHPDGKYAEQDGLAESIQRIGLQDPLSVMHGDPKDPLCKDPKKLYLWDGFRRYRALIGLEATEARCEIWPWLSPVERRLKQAAVGGEGAGRVKLSSVELAYHLVALQEDAGRRADKPDAWNLTGAAIKAITGISESYASNMMNCVRRCHPDVLKAWREGVRGLTTDVMTAMNKMNHDDQLKELNRILGIVTTDEGVAAAGEGDEGEGKTRGPTGPRKLSRQKAEELIERLTSDEVKGWIKRTFKEPIEQAHVEGQRIAMVRTLRGSFAVDGITSIGFMRNGAPMTNGDVYPNDELPKPKKEEGEEEKKPIKW